ncbi:MAG: NAD(P) transhydrogenase subunit alpha [Betaproteobacteria bacterium]|nr:NAD(P) transhydrogenase subunit alpha [Betaproteobacteria bacterium]
MPLHIGLIRETAPGERRIAAIPEVVKKFQALGVQFCIERGAGEPCFYRDDDFSAEGVSFAGNATEIFGKIKLLLKVAPPTREEIAALPEGSVVAGLLEPYADPERLKLLNERRITSFALELIPRISRAQSMDALSSQATVSGYLCALIAADHSPKFFPLLTYAAGTLRPAQVLVIGAGVAGLQTIATAKRLGAQVFAYDVRPETREQVESLGARFVDTGVSAAGAGGYARDLTDEEKKQQEEALARTIARMDVLITTAAIPGRAAPRIVSAAMRSAMKPGAVIVDMAAESGGNVEGAIAGQTQNLGGVMLIGPNHLPSRMPVHASEMYAKNLFNFLSPCIRDGEWNPDWEDEIIAGACLTHAGEVRHEGVKRILGL